MTRTLAPDRVWGDGKPANGASEPPVPWNRKVDPDFP